jgi:hypothetical protein
MSQFSFANLSTIPRPARQISAPLPISIPVSVPRPDTSKVEVVILERLHLGGKYTAKRLGSTLHRPVREGLKALAEKKLVIYDPSTNLWSLPPSEPAAVTQMWIRSLKYLLMEEVFTPNPSALLTTPQIFQHYEGTRSREVLDEALHVLLGEGRIGHTDDGRWFLILETRSFTPPPPIGDWAGESDSPAPLADVPDSPNPFNTS